MTFEDLQKIIIELTEDLAKHSMREIYASCYSEMMRIDWTKPQKMNLSSPFRQVSYIASLALSTKEKEQSIPLGEEEWKSICEKTNRIYDYYTFMHFPDGNDFSSISEETHRKGFTTIPAFLLNLCNGTHASVQQIKEDIVSLYSRYSEQIESKIGIGITDIISVCDFIEEVLLDRIQNGIFKLGDAWQLFNKDIKRGIRHEQAIAASRERMNEKIYWNMNKMGVITASEIKNKFGNSCASTFLNLFSQSRNISEHNSVIYPTEKLTIYTRPLADLGDENFALITGNHLILAVQKTLSECIAELGLWEQFHKYKGRVLEEKALSLLKLIFGEKAEYYAEVYETPKDNNEHDIIIIYKKSLLIVECKAKQLNKEFRDIDKAFTRISQSFKTYIQEGYTQARNLEKLLLSQKETTLYKKGGDIACKISSCDFDNIEKLIITYDNEGFIATKVSLLLEIDDGATFPCCLNIHDLKQLANYKDDIGLTNDKFTTYLNQRKLIYDKVGNDDELDIFGYFLKEHSLDKIIQADCEIFNIHPGYSSIFDEAYLKNTSHKVSKSDMPIQRSRIKIGRNEPCSCGSGVKYKRCHGK